MKCCIMLVVHDDDDRETIRDETRDNIMSKKSSVITVIVNYHVKQYIYIYIYTYIHTDIFDYNTTIWTHVKKKENNLWETITCRVPYSVCLLYITKHDVHLYTIYIVHNNIHKRDKTKETIRERQLHCLFFIYLKICIVHCT